MKSMTGYGRGTSKTEQYEITAELRAVNCRYLELSVRLPRCYVYLEEKLKELIQTGISRGKAELSLTILAADGKAPDIRIHHGVVKAYLAAMTEENQRLAAELGGMASEGYLPQDLTLSTLLQLPNAFQVQQVTEDAAVMWEFICPAVQEALAQFTQMREIEGLRLKQDIVFRLDALEQMVCQVEELAPRIVTQYYNKLYKKITELLESTAVDESRLVTEAAVLAEKIAVDEETVRLHSHIAQFRTLLESAEPVGRKMDFLVQEMNREVNTTGSKAQSLEITRLVVDMKSEIEKIREQIQNIE